MGYLPAAPGRRLENCRECKKLFYQGVDDKICKYCKGGYKIINGELFVTNKERFKKQKDYKIKT